MEPLNTSSINIEEKSVGPQNLTGHKHSVEVEHLVFDNGSQDENNVGATRDTSYKTGTLDGVVDNASSQSNCLFEYEVVLPNSDSTSVVARPNPKMVKTGGEALERKLKKYRQGIENLLVQLIGEQPIAMPNVLSVTMALIQNEGFVTLPSERSPPKPPWAYSSSSFHQKPSVPTSARPPPKPQWKKNQRTYTQTVGALNQNSTNLSEVGIMKDPKLFILLQINLGTRSISRRMDLMDSPVQRIARGACLCFKRGNEYLLKLCIASGLWTRAWGVLEISSNKQHQQQLNKYNMD